MYHSKCSNDRMLNSCNLKIVKIFKLIEHYFWVLVSTKLYSSIVDKPFNKMEGVCVSTT
jgi:hypothetical protein